MSQIVLYPMFFEPIFQYRPWGGRHLADLFNEPLPGNDPIGEAWILSDRDDHESLEGNGELEHGGILDAVGRGDVLLPAVAGVCAFIPTVQLPYCKLLYQIRFVKHCNTELNE